MSQRFVHCGALLLAVALAVLIGCEPPVTKTKKTKSPKTGPVKVAPEKTEGVKTTEKTEIKTEEAKTEAKTEEMKTVEAKTEAKTEVKTEAKTEVKTEAKTEEMKTVEAKTETKTEAKTETKETKTGEMKTEAKTEVKTEAKTEAKTEETKTAEAKTEAKTEVMKTEPKTEVKTETKTEVKTETKTEEKTETKPAAATPLKKAELLATLPDSCNTPDGMTLMPDESVIVSVPNYNDQKQPPLLIKITKDNKVEEFFKLPPHPDTGRIGPMGIRLAPNGDLYLADNQLFHDKDYPNKLLFGKSRLLRIVMKDGKPTDVVSVATGLNVANGIAINGDYIYITETILVPDSKPLVSGVYRFKLDDKNVAMKTPLKDDPHLVTTQETQGKTGFGADGICVDKNGNLYVSDFTDGVIYRMKVGPDGKATEKKLFAKGMKSCDGMDYDPKTEKIYSADLMGNGVNVIDMDGKVERLAEDPANDGSTGQLRAACEALVRGDTIVVGNMDFPVPGGVIQKYTKPATISVIKLK
jgi:hypothetical protein